MVACSALNCTSRSGDGFKLFRFPGRKGQLHRKKKWEINCRRKNWTSNKCSRLCENHFESSQFFDMKTKRLKSNAVPTLFQIPNPPKKLTGMRTSKNSINACTSKLNPTYDVYEEHAYCKQDEYDKQTGTSACMALSSVNVSELADEDANESIYSSVASHCKCCQESKVENRRLRWKIKQLENQLNQCTQKFEAIWNKDQLDSLKFPSSKVQEWSLKTIQDGLKIRLMIGANGYEYLRKLSYPLPSYRTLCERVSTLKMQPGIQYQILDYMGAKFKSDELTYCSLVLDEMQISPGIEYDLTLKRFIGVNCSEIVREKTGVTEPSEATHALVYMVKGLCQNWKQVVAYYFTGSSIDGEKLWGVTKSIITELATRGMIVKGIISDMGPCNQSMWRAGGIASRRCDVSEKCSHPSKLAESIYFFADPPHLMKSLRSCLLSNDIELPPSIAKKYCLPSTKVSMHWIELLVEYDSSNTFKLAPKLKETHIHPTQYEKMRVDVACQVLSHSTASAIRTLVALEKMDPAAFATAFFCELANSWFDVVNTRYIANAMFANSTRQLDVLKEMMEVVRSSTIKQKHKHGKTSWKPVQAGIQLSNKSLLGLHSEMVIEKKSMNFLMPGRLSQDALENVFSQIRNKGISHPGPSKFRTNLKLVCLSQLMHIPSNSSYDEDDAPHLLNFVNGNNKAHPEDKHSKQQVIDPEIINKVKKFLTDECEINGFYYVCGWAVRKVLKKVTCANCCNILTASSISRRAWNNCAMLTLIKSYTKNPLNFIVDDVTTYLCHPSSFILQFFKQVEICFQCNIARAVNVNNPTDYIKERVAVDFSTILSCHVDVCEKLVRSYLKLRFYIHSKEMLLKFRVSQHGSKSAARQTIK